MYSQSFTVSAASSRVVRLLRHATLHLQLFTMCLAEVDEEFSLRLRNYCAETQKHFWLLSQRFFARLEHVERAGEVSLSVSLPLNSITPKHVCNRDCELLYLKMWGEEFSEMNMENSRDNFISCNGRISINYVYLMKNISSIAKLRHSHRSVKPVIRSAPCFKFWTAFDEEICFCSWNWLSNSIVTTVFLKWYS